MTVTREDLNPCTVKLTVVCGPEEVKEGYEKALKQISKNIRLPGFRPGHAPRAMIEPLIGREEWNSEAIESIARKIAPKAIEQEGLKPDPSIRLHYELAKLQREPAECEFSIKVPLPPIVEIGEYKGLEMAKRSAEVTDEEVEYQLNLLRNRRSTREAVTDRGVEEGDIAVVNVKIEGGEGEGRTFMTVAGQTFPQFDEILMGMKVEEVKQVTLTFPDSFQEKDWAGRTQSCMVSVASLSAVTLPKLDEAFAKSMRTETVDELKSRLRSGIAAAKENSMREEMNEELMEKLLEKSTVHVPDNMWEDLAQRRLQETIDELAKNGKTLEDYSKEIGMTPEEFAANRRETALLQVKRALLIREVFSREKMTLTNEELNSALVTMSEEYEIEPAELLAILKKNRQMEELQFRAFATKVANFLRENAHTKEAVTA